MDNKGLYLLGIKSERCLKRKKPICLHNVTQRRLQDCPEHSECFSLWEITHPIYPPYKLEKSGGKNRAGDVPVRRKQPNGSDKMEILALCHQV